VGNRIRKVSLRSNKNAVRRKQPNISGSPCGALGAGAGTAGGTVDYGKTSQSGASGRT
jgi:hypothetical protein